MKVNNVPTAEKLALAQSENLNGEINIFRERGGEVIRTWFY